MKFCESCGSILVVKSCEGERCLLCRKCNKSFLLTEDIKINSFFSEGEKEIKIIEGDELKFPTTKALCPRCNEIVEAFWWMQQTRSTDEPPTRFYQCRKCKHRWREYS